MELSLFCDTYIIAEYLRLKKVLDDMPRYNAGVHNGIPVIREYSGSGDKITVKTAHLNTKTYIEFLKRLTLFEQYNSLKKIYKNEINRRHLSIPSEFKFISEQSEFDYKFWNQAVPCSNGRKNDTDYKDEYGYKVRSRGEIIVGSALKDLGLEAKFEPLLSLKNGKVKSPDYVFPVKIINRCFFIEFIGMTDDVDYMNRNYGKTDEYMRSGILPNRDLILICGKENWIPTQGEIKRIIASFINNAVLRTYNKNE